MGILANLLAYRMSDCCNDECGIVPQAHERRFRRILWIVLLANVAMFIVEIGASWKAESTALMADAIDFFGDAINYGVSLAALAAGAVWRSRVALAKGWVMGFYGVAVLVVAGINVVRGASPEASIMALVATLALLVNVGAAFLLYAFRDGDANMRSVWLCSRNDAIGNVAVVLAAAGVFGTGSLWPDVGVAMLLASLGLLAARHVIERARLELAAQRNVTAQRGQRAAQLHD